MALNLTSVLVVPCGLFFPNVEGWCILRAFRYIPAGLDGSFHVRLCAVGRDNEPIEDVPGWYNWRTCGLYTSTGSRLLDWRESGTVRATVDLMDDPADPDAGG